MSKVVFFSLAFSFLIFIDNAYSFLESSLSEAIKEMENISLNLSGPRSSCSLSEPLRQPPKLSDTCLKSTTPQLRSLFLSFYQSATNKKELKQVLPKLLAMTVKESSGNPVAVADMKGNGGALSYKSFFKENKSHGIMSKDHYGNISLLEKNLSHTTTIFNKQTNFGLAQISADRMDLKNWGGDYLKEILPMLQKKNAKSFYEWCLSSKILKESETKFQQYYQKNIKTCKASTKTIDGIKCFGRIVTLCPRLNIELALKQPKKYFETRRAIPLCTKLFN